MSIIVKQEVLRKNKILGKNLVDKRDYESTKKNVDEMIRDNYEEYLYIAAGVKPPCSDSSGNIHYEQHIQKNTDKVGNQVARKVDWEANELYQNLLEAYNRMTIEEYVCFENYLNYVSEADIASKLHFSNKTALVRHKKSAIIKAAMIFNIDVLK